tara:strand:- start:209 stop:805 length:597 start_codon:yes stop_codon:yes gene_type:complete
MENFSTVFAKLKDERGLSNKQIASFTGASIKDIKKWDSGVGIPTDKRIIAALEGILGNEITAAIGSIPEEETFKRQIFNVENSIFEVDKTKEPKISSGFLNRFRSNIEKKERNPQTEMFTYEDITETQEKEIADLELSENNYESALEESPYINDPNQLNFYFSRNFKSVVAILFFFYLTYIALQLFMGSFRLLIDNLL